MTHEIERTFLVTYSRWRDHTRGRGVEIVQGYLHSDEGTSIRVRLLGTGDAVLTVERGGGAVREEVPLDRAAAEQLLDGAIVGEILHKRRWLVDVPALGGDGWDLVAEVDEFGGALDGFVLADVALPSADVAVPEVAWLGDEVTDDPRFTNARLALDGLPPDADDLPFSVRRRASG